MSNVITFTPRPRSPKPQVALSPAGVALRVHLEEAAYTALDAADRIIAALDHLDDADPADPDAVADPRMASALQVLRVGDLGRFHATGVQPVHPRTMMTTRRLGRSVGAETSTKTLQVEPGPFVASAVCPELARLPWGATGDVVSAAGCALLALVVGAA